MALWLAEGLLNKGHEVEVWYLYKKRPIQSETIHQLVLNEKKPRGILQNLLLILKLIKAVKKCKPDVVISHTHYANILCQPVSWFLRVPKRIAVQHSPVWTYPRLARQLDPIMALTGIYTSVVAVSECVATSLEVCGNNYKKKSSVICNGVPEIKEIPLKDIELQRNEFGLPEAAFIAINVGRLSKEKNQSFLLKLLVNIPEMFLIIAGEGELNAELRMEAEKLGVSKRVCFTGEVPYSQIGALLKLSDVFLFPSLYEAFGLALVEAMRSELPVITNDIPAAHEIVGSAGYILPLKLDDWVNAINNLHDNPSLKKLVGQKAKETSQKYSINNAVEQYEKLF